MTASEAVAYLDRQWIWLKITDLRASQIVAQMLADVAVEVATAREPRA